MIHAKAVWGWRQVGLGLLLALFAMMPPWGPDLFAQEASQVQKANQLQPEQAQPAESAAAELLASFPVFADGDMLLVPVTVAGKSHLFMLDTGFTVTTFDRRLSAAVGPGRAIRVEGGSGFEEALAQEFSVAGLPPVVRQRIWTADLTTTRESSGHDIAGVVGIDLLRTMVVFIDADHARVEFRRSTKGLLPDQAPPIALSQNRLGSFNLRAELSPGVVRPLLVDTGALSIEPEIDLSPALYDELLRRNALRHLYKVLTSGVGRLGESRTGMVKELKLTDGARLMDVRATEHADGLDLLGLSCLVQFNTILDFPNQRMYLLPRERHIAPQLHGQGSGLGLIRRQGMTLVVSVRGDSRAAEAGFRTGDRLVEVGEHLAAELRLHRIRTLLETTGEELPVTVVRSSGERQSLKIARRKAP